MREAAPTPAKLLAALLGALALLALPAPALADSPWWQLTSGSRPAHLQPAPDASEVQEVKTTVNEALASSFAARVEVAGQTIGCLGTGPYAGLCEPETDFTPSEDLQGMLAGAPGAPYGEDVEVSGGPIGGEPLLVTTPGRWVAPLVLTPLRYEVEAGLVTDIGSVSTAVISEGSGRVVLTATNLGDATLEAGETPLVIEDRLPPGVTAYGAEAFAGVSAGDTGAAGPVACAVEGLKEGGETVSRVLCSFEDELLPYEAIEVEIPVALQAGSGGAGGRVRISGGDGPEESIPQDLSVDAAPVPFGLQSFSALAEAPGGGPADAAGSRPYQLTNTVQLNSGRVIQFGPFHSESVVEQPAVPRNTAVTLPAGLAGSATAVPSCSLADFFAQKSDFSNECPAQSAVGVASVTIIEAQSLGLVRVPVPIFNLPPAHGEPARFGFMPVGVPVTIDTAVDPEDSYRIVGEVRNASQTAQVLAATISLWGVPGDPRHDSARGWSCLPYIPAARAERHCEPPVERDETPLLRLPVSCADPLRYDALLEPWNSPPGAVAPRYGVTAAPPVSCNQVPFDPRIAATLTSKVASSSTGIDFELQQPQSWPADPRGLAEAQPEKVEVTLPEGLTVNPSEAEGLAVCSPAAYSRETAASRPGEGCPEASKIGTVSAATPLLAEEPKGALYLAEPYENPSHSLLALYMVLRVPERGILIKQAGKVEPDPRTGQLITTFEGLPQLPYESFKLHFREGARAPLIAPPGCGDYTTLAKFVPYSAADPRHPDPAEVVERSAAFTVQRGVDGGGCPSGQAPFNPGFEAGTLNNQAASYSPFVMHLTRGDGEQDMGKFSFTLPPGVVGKLAGIPYCPEAGIARAKARQGAHGGQEEIDDPSCPAASQIGTTLGGAGVGSQLTYVGGKLYLAGPWHGDPLSVVAITPAVAGPFDAGTVVVREALRLNPVTARAEVDGAASDPIPHILKGIPLELRDLRVYADRPDFTLNATSCEPFAAESTIWGEGTALEPLAPHPVDLSARYQAAGCASLGFEPKLNLKLKGGTRRGAFPALHAAYVPRKHGDANLSRLALTFPSSEFIEQGHFRTICTRVQFAAGQGFGAECPKGSIYGHVKVFTPLLDQPLQGPVYLRSSNHNLPDAVFALHGLVDIEVAVRIDSTHGRLRATVADAPDAPVSRAVVRMGGGQKGLFVNSRSLCVKPRRNRARAAAKGHNGRRALLRPLMRASGCAKAKRKAHRGHSSPPTRPAGRP